MNDKTFIKRELERYEILQMPIINMDKEGGEEPPKRTKEEASEIIAQSILKRVYELEEEK